jgi:hypothetical protein
VQKRPERNNLTLGLLCKNTSFDSEDILSHSTKPVKFNIFSYHNLRSISRLRPLSKLLREPYDIIIWTEVQLSIATDSITQKQSDSDPSMGQININAEILKDGGKKKRIIGPEITTSANRVTAPNHIAHKGMPGGTTDATPVNLTPTDPDTDSDTTKSHTDPRLPPQMPGSIQKLTIDKPNGITEVLFQMVMTVDLGLWTELRTQHDTLMEAVRSYYITVNGEGIVLPSIYQPLVETYTSEDMGLGEDDIYQLNLAESIRICDVELEELLNYAKLMGLKILRPVRFQGESPRSLDHPYPPFENPSLEPEDPNQDLVETTRFKQAPPTPRIDAGNFKNEARQLST